MKKRLLSAALAVCMLFGSAAALPQGYFGDSTGISASADTYGSYTYTVLNDGTVQVTNYSGKEDSLTIPISLNGYTVSIIGANNAVGMFTRLGMANTTLKTLVLPATAKTITASALAECHALTSVTLPSGLTTINNYAFLNCKALATITIPKNVTSIASNAFDGCTALKSISVDSSNTSYSAYDGALYNKAQTTLVYCPLGKTSLNIPGTVKTVPGKTGGAGITAVTLNEGTTTLSKWAFINCKGMKSITIPKSVTSIGAQAVGYYHANAEDTDPETKISGFIIYGYKGSAAETYATNNGFTFIALGETTACTHTYGNPVWTWNGTSSATVAFTCSKCGDKQTPSVRVTNAVTKEATCTTIGTRTYTATTTFNGKEYTDKKTADIAVNSNHDWSGTPTWVWDGYKSAYLHATCKNNVNHIMNTDAKITSKVTTAPTCNSTGTTTHTATATFNGKNYTTSKTETTAKDPNAHNWGTPTWTWSSDNKTCTAKFTCKNYSVHTQTVNATVTNSVTKAATCSATGTRTYTAKVTFNGTTYTTTKTETIAINSSAHTWNTTPTWTWNGYTSATAKLTCKNNSSHTASANATITSTVTKAATCTATGTRTYTAKATINGTAYTTTKTETIAATGHDWGTPTWTWSGYTSATAKFTCKTDSSHTTLAASKITNAVTKAATCTATGTRTYTATATFNGKTYTNTKTETIAATGHTWGAWVTTKQPTATTTGTKERTCSVCKTKETATIPTTTHTHSYKTTVVAPTCTAQGYTLHSCTGCDDSYKDTYKSALGHSYGTTPSWTWTGYTSAKATFTCTRCSNKSSVNATITNAVTKAATCSATGVRTYTAKVTFNSKTYSTTKTETIAKNANAHTWGAWTTTKAATVIATGTREHTCTACKTTQQETMKKLDLRLYGDSRYDTSIAIANQLKKENGNAKFKYVIIASGTDSADALSATYLASKNKNTPILITSTADKTMTQIADYIKNNAASGATIYIIGGTGAVPKAMETKLSGKGYTIKRLGGKNRYLTNIEVLKEAKVTNQELLVASGTVYADALSASAVGKPILLVSGNSLLKEQKDYLATLTGTTATIIGGTGAVSTGIQTQLKAVKNKSSKTLTVSRLGGADRYATSALVANKYFSNPPTVVLAYGLNFPDGLCGGPLALQYKSPLLLATTKATAEAQKYAKAKGMTNTVTFGGTSLISNDALKTILSK